MKPDRKFLLAYIHLQGIFCTLIRKICDQNNIFNLTGSISIKIERRAIAVDFNSGNVCFLKEFPFSHFIRLAMLNNEMLKKI